MWGQHVSVADDPQPCNHTPRSFARPMNGRRRTMIIRPVTFALAVLLGTLGCVVLPSGAALAQFSPIKIVNERAISQYEFDQRLAFMTLLRQPGDLPVEAMKGLVDDRLRQFAADQAGIVLTPEALTAGLEEFASRANLTAEQFVKAINQGGVDAETYRDFVQSGLLWRDLVRARFGQRVQVTEAAIDRALANFKPTSAITVLTSEIVIPAAGAGRSAALVRARKLSAELKSGGDFAAAARANSSGATAGSGGAVDWRRLSEFKPEAAVVVRALTQGQVSNPVILDDSVVIYLLRDQAQEEVSATAATVVDYAEYLIPNDGAAKDVAAKIRAQTDSCDDLYAIARGQPADRLRRQTVAQSQLPGDVASAVALLDAGESSTAITRGGARVFLMLCSRGAAPEDQPSRDEIRLQLTNQQLGTLAEIYLEELRSEAIIVDP